MTDGGPSPVTRWRLAVDMSIQALSLYVGDATLAPVIAGLEDGSVRASDPRLRPLWRALGDEVRLRQAEWFGRRRCGVPV